MSQLPAMPLWASDFFSKTDHLTNEEQWAYLKLLMKTWVRNCRWFPDNEEDLARLLDMGVKRWRKIRPRLAPFFDLSKGVWRQENLEKQFLYASQRREILRSNGSLGGRPKSSKPNGLTKPKGLLLQNQNESNHTHKEEDTPPYEDPNGSSSPLGGDTPTDNPPQEAKPNGRGAKQKRQIAADWQPDLTDREYAAKRGWDAESITEQGDAFRDFHASRGTLFLDWHAGWRTWVRNADRFAARDAPRGNGTRRVAKSESVLDAMRAVLNRGNVEHR